MPVKVFAPQAVSIYARKRKVSASAKEYWGFEPVSLGKGRKPTGPFFLRHTDGGKQKWVPAGDTFQQVTELRDKLMALKDAQRQGLPLDEADRETAEALGGKTIKDAIDDYLKANNNKKTHTLKAYKTTLENFRECLSHRVRLTIDLREEHVWQFVDCMKQDGKANKTINTRTMYVRVFLNWLKDEGHISTEIKIDGLKLPKSPKKKVEAYSAEHLRKLKATADDEERAFIEFMLATGCREQEAEYAEWSDINFHDRTHTVQEKKHYNFTPKSYEHRVITLPAELMDVLKERKKHSKSALLFPSSTGKPDGHLLRILKAVAFRAGLNCKECKAKQDGAKKKSCADGPVCRKHYLHRLRKTFATRMHHAGVPLRDLQGMLGHESLKTTEQYLAESERTDTRIGAAADRAFNLDGD